MFRKFLIWFFCFGFSFLASTFGVAEQGKAFLYIDLGVDIFVFAFAILIILFPKYKSSDYDIEDVISICMHSLWIIIVSLIATWGASKLFRVDFFVAYQIMTFGQCWDNNRKYKA